MEKAYLGDKEVKGCFLGDIDVTESFLGSVAICSTGPVGPTTARFIMHVTALVKPTYYATGGTLTIVDNNDGTWTLSSSDAITKLERNHQIETEVVVEKALDLVEIEGTWESSHIVSFDTSGLTSVTNVVAAWNNCTNLLSFDTSGLTSATDISDAWGNCGSLNSFDASGLTSVTNARYPWMGCPFTPNPPINPSTGTNVW